jgi:ABC-2 type transport system permease protein
MTTGPASRILAVAWREATVLRHDKGFLSTVLIQPVVMLLLFGYALSMTPRNVPWAVLDRSQSGPSRRLVEDVRTSGYFLAPTPVSGYAEGRDLLRTQRALALLVVPKSFRRDVERGRPHVQLLLDGSDPVTAARVGAYVGQIAQSFVATRTVAPRRGAVPVARTAGPVDVRQRFAFNPRLSDRVFMVATLVGMLLTNLCLSVSSLGIVGERESGTYEQTLSLPVTGLEIVLGKLVPLVVVSYGLVGFTILLQGVAFGLWPTGSLLGLLLVTLPFVLASLAIGVFISALASGSAQAVFITVFFIMPSFVLSGVMFPYQLMPKTSLAVGALFPLRWYQIALRRLMTRGGGFEDVLVPFAAMLLIFGVLLVAIRWRLQPRLG